MSQTIITIDATLQEIEGFADRLAYVPEITVDGIATPNPETREVYFERKLTEIVSSVLSAPYIAEIDQVVRNEREAEKEALRANIRSRVQVNFVP